MENLINTDTLTSFVNELFSIDEITIGSKQQGFVARYRGMLKEKDSEHAFNLIKYHLDPMSILPILRWEGNRQELTLLSVQQHTSPGKSWINILLFILTSISVLYAGALYATGTDPFAGPINLLQILKFLLQGWPFAVSFLGILAAHEFGHYFMGRFHKVKVSLPYFIPFPLSQIGTMGAFINMKEPPRNKKHMLDIAMAGPLAGLIIAIPVLILGLSLSKVETIPAIIPEGFGFQIEGNSILYLLTKYLMFGKLLPQPMDYGAVAPLFYWIKYFFTGMPAPLGGMDVMIHPVAWAAWAGLLVTSLNLIPAGQLDGGHIFHVLFGRKGSRIALPAIILALAALGFVWNGWWLWVILILFFGRRSAEPLDQITPIDTKRKWLAGFTLLIFILTFMPVPLLIITG
jgi:membrane-associated protease RseP (regulator of RpoE activity)